MSINEHDRGRVHALAEEFIEVIEKYGENSEVDDITLDHFIIVGICGVGLVDSEYDVELPIHVGSTQRPFIQRGILESVLDRLKMPDGRVDESE